MEPSFQQIADLFAIPTLASTEVEQTKPRVMGRTAEESEQLGRACLTDGDAEAAIAHFQMAIELRRAALHHGEQPEAAGAELVAAPLVDLGGAYEYTDQSPQAFRQYAKALRARKDDPEPLLGISDLYKRHGRYRDAVEQLETALELKPDDGFLWFKLAETFREMGERKRALASAMRAIEITPENAFYHFWVGDLLIVLERYEEALASLRAAVELSPGDDYLYIRVAVAFWRTGKKTEAIKAIRLASDLDPEKNIYHGLLEALLDEAGQTEEADLESERADQMDAYDQATLAKVLVEMGIQV